MNPKDTYAKILSKEIHAETSPNGELTTNTGTLQEIQNQRLYNYFLQRNLTKEFFFRHTGQTVVVPLNSQQLRIIAWLIVCVGQAEKMGVTLRFKPINSPTISNKLSDIEQQVINRLKKNNLLA